MSPTRRATPEATAVHPRRSPGRTMGRGLAAAGLLAGVTGLSGVLVAGAGVASAGVRHTTHHGVRSVRHARGKGAWVATAKVSDLGLVLVDSAGKTLYLFTPDKQKSATCHGGCLAVWPPLTTSAVPVAGHGVDKKLLASMKWGRAKQVTYDRWPLYTFSGDSKGTANGEGIKSFGGSWWAVHPNGQPAKPAVKATTTAKTGKAKTGKTGKTGKGSGGSSGSGGGW